MIGLLFLKWCLEVLLQGSGRFRRSRRQKASKVKFATLYPYELALEQLPEGPYQYTARRAFEQGSVAGLLWVIDSYLAWGQHV